MKVVYDDCMKVMKELADKSFQLCLTDPPYDEGYDNKPSPIKTLTIKDYQKRKAKKTHYEDKMDKDWYLAWLDEVLRVSDGAMFTCGTKHYHDWVRWREPDYQELYWYKSNSCSYIKAEPILCYGKIKNYSHLRQVIEVPLNVKKERPVIHSTAKPLGLYLYILRKIKPDSVMDPFAGSGTTGEAAKILGIENCLLIEKNKTYETDINARISTTIREKDQVGMDNFFRHNEERRVIKRLSTEEK